jgi:hypothetical protein
LWPNGGRSVDGETAISKREEQVQAFVAQEVFTLQQVKYFVREQLLRGVGIDIGDRQPLTVLVPDPTRGDAMSMRMHVQNTPKRLRHGDHPGTGFVVTGGLAHQLVDGLISEANEISEELASVHEIRSEHFWNRESPQAMDDVFQKLVLEKGGKGGCPLRVT